MPRKFQIILACSLLFYQVRAAALDLGDKFGFDQVRLINGQTIASSQFQNKYLIIEIWATWCPYCRRQNVNLQKLYSKIVDTNLAILTFSVDKDPVTVEDYLKVNEYDFPVAMMTATLSAQFGKRRGIPEIYVVDPSGTVIQKDYGLMVDADFDELIRYKK